MVGVPARVGVLTRVAVDTAEKKPIKNSGGATVVARRGQDGITGAKTLLEKLMDTPMGDKARAEGFKALGKYTDMLADRAAGSRRDATRRTARRWSGLIGSLLVSMVSLLLYIVREQARLGTRLFGRAGDAVGNVGGSLVGYAEAMARKCTIETTYEPTACWGASLGVSCRNEAFTDRVCEDIPGLFSGGGINRGALASTFGGLLSRAGGGFNSAADLLDLTEEYSEKTLDNVLGSLWAGATALIAIMVLTVLFFTHANVDIRLPFTSFRIGDRARRRSPKRSSKRRRPHRRASRRRRST